jgi:hypothetical protein
MQTAENCASHDLAVLGEGMSVDLLGRGGPAAQGFWTAAAAHARASTKGERLLRTSHGHGEGNDRNNRLESLRGAGARSRLRLDAQ